MSTSGGVDSHFEDVRNVHVDEMGGITATNAIVVDLTARAARARLAHLPEVVLNGHHKEKIKGKQNEKHGDKKDTRAMGIGEIAELIRFYIIG